MVKLKPDELAGKELVVGALAPAEATHQVDNEQDKQN